MVYKKGTTLHAALRTTNSGSRSLKGEEFITVEQLKSASQVVLAVLAAAGIGLIAVTAPNMLQAVDKFFVRKHKRSLSKAQREEKLTQAIYYLKRSNLIRVKSGKTGWTFGLTSGGRQKIQKIKISAVSIPKPRSWDGKWWLVAADIPTLSHRQGADLLRRKLRELKFYPLQRTLWMFPYNPQKALQFIVDTFQIGQFVTLMEVSSLDEDDERRLRSFFREHGIL